MHCSEIIPVVRNTNRYIIPSYRCITKSKEYRFALFFLQNKVKEYTSHGSLTLLLIVIYIILIYILINSKI